MKFKDINLIFDNQTHLYYSENTQAEPGERKTGKHYSIQLNKLNKVFILALIQLQWNISWKNFKYIGAELCLRAAGVSVCVGNIPFSELIQRLTPLLSLP